MSHTETPVFLQTLVKGVPAGAPLHLDGEEGPWAEVFGGKRTWSGLSDLPGGEGLRWEPPCGSSALARLSQP